ncbi:MAG TPA: hypothetical protein VGO85_03280 [Caldimonas sp.]|jgi:anti-sigma factor RsiW|nr:hypothetical protein [Caldimonas sp.]
MKDSIAMNAVPDWKELSAFVDGELTDRRAREIEARVKESAPLGSRIAELRHLQTVMLHGTDYHRAPEALRLAILDASRPPRSQHAFASRRAAASPWPGIGTLQRWFAWRPLASSLALASLLAFTLNLTQSTISHTDQLQEEIVTSHVRATLSHRLVDLASSDRQALGPFLSSRLDFSPPVHELTFAGSSLVGGRVDYVDGRAVAAVVYRLGDHVVDSFVWPTRDGDSSLTGSTRRGFQLARWSRNGLAHCLVSDLSPEQLAAIARQLEAASPEPASS